MNSRRTGSALALLVPLLALSATSHAAKPPAAEAGPDLAERATQTPLAVDAVTVFSDRALIRRAGPVQLKRGVLVLRTPDLPGATWVDTVRVKAEGARVVRVETQPVDRERYSIDQVDEWLAGLESRGDEIADRNARLAIVRQQLQQLSELNVAPPVDEQHRVGKPAPTLHPAVWRGVQDELGKRRAALRAEERQLEAELRDLHKGYDKLRRDVSQRDLGGFSERKVQVVVILEGERAGKGSLELEYYVPGAFWKPSYDLHFDPDAGTVELQATGRVTQATGEDWDRTQLLFSTAIPGRGIELPELITWTLGDDREYRPRPFPRQSRQGVRPFEPPSPKPRIAELVQQADRSVLQSRTSLLLAIARGGRAPASPADTPYTKTRTIDFGDMDISGELSQPEGEYLARPRASRAPPPPPAPPGEPEPMPMAMADEDDGRSFGASAGAVLESAGRAIFGKKKPSARSASMALLAGNEWSRPVLSDRTLPAMTAGGFDYVFEAPVRASVPSQAEGLRVPLASRKYKVATFYEATPSLAETAYLKAVVRNGSELPILAGPANIFVKGAFSGDAELRTTGPGGDLELPLGADEDIRLTHTVEPQTRTQGLIFTDEVTEYLVTIEVGNYKKKPVTVRVIDQVPKTNNEKIEIELLSSKPRAVPADADGLLHWDVEVEPGKTRKIFFRYSIKRPKDWRLYQ